MKSGGWLDGFPLHLLFLRDSSPVGPVLCLDSAALGHMQLGSCPEPKPVIVVSPRADLTVGSTDDSVADSVAEAVVDLADGLWQVVADRTQLPFRGVSLSGWIEVVSDRTGQSDERAEQKRVLSKNAILVGIAEDPTGFTRDSASIDAGSTSRFEIRPQTGAEYFVTRVPAPSRSPFRSLQLGKSAALREHLPDWLPLPTPASLVLEVRSKQETCIDDFWAEDVECGMFVKPNWNALLVGGEDAVIKFPLLPEGVDRLRGQADQLEQVRRELPSSLAELVPRPVELGLRSGQLFLRESVRPGRPIPLGWWKPNWSKRAYCSAAEFLIEWHRHPVTNDVLSFQNVDALLFDRIETVTTAGQLIEGTFSLAELQVLLQERLIGEAIPRVRTHGDFWGGNILVDESGKVSGVLDWDASNSLGWPLIDLFHLLAYRKKRRAYWKFGERITDWLLPESWTSWEAELVHRYCTELNLREHQRETLKVVYWLERVYQWWLTNSSEAWIDQDWIRRNIVEIAPKLASSLHEVD